MSKAGSSGTWSPTAKTLSVPKSVVALSIASAVLVVGTPIFVSEWNRGMAEPSSQASTLWIALSFTLTYLPVAVVLLKVFPDIRTWNLRRRFPNRGITSVVRSNGLKAASRQLVILQQPPDYSSTLPGLMSLVVDNDGLELWGGVFRPQQRWTELWENVGEMTTVRAEVGSRDRWAVEITVASGAGTVGLPLVFMSSRFWGYAATTKQEATEIMGFLEGFRLAHAS